MATTRRGRTLVAVTAAAAAAAATVAALVAAPGGAAAAAAAAASAPTFRAADLAAALSRGARLGTPAAAADAAAAATAAGAPAVHTAAYSPTVYGGLPLTGPSADYTPYLARIFRLRDDDDDNDDDSDSVSYVCAGLLVTERHVVTVAGCPFTPGKMVLLAGGDGVAITGGIAFNLTRRVGEPAFNATTSEADVAVWTYDAPPTATATALALAGIVRGRVARSPAAPAAATVGLVGGWGVVDPREAQGIAAGRPTNLTVTVQSVVSAALCAGTYRLVGVAPPPADVFCAAGASSGPCFGDEGAPLAAYEDTPAAEPYFVGLYASGFASDGFLCDPRAPAVYTRLSAHVPFLAAAVAPFKLSLFG